MDGALCLMRRVATIQTSPAKVAVTRQVRGGAEKRCWQVGVREVAGKAQAWPQHSSGEHHSPRPVFECSLLQLLSKAGKVPDEVSQGCFPVGCCRSQSPGWPDPLSPLGALGSSGFPPELASQCWHQDGCWGWSHGQAMVSTDVSLVSKHSKGLSLQQSRYSLP